MGSIVADDIIIAASLVEEHGHILQQVLDRAMERNVNSTLKSFNLTSVLSTTLVV